MFISSVEINPEVVKSTKAFLRRMLSTMQMGELETAAAMEEMAAEIRAARSPGWADSQKP